jgi:hypothetical protein
MEGRMAEVVDLGAAGTPTEFRMLNDFLLRGLATSDHQQQIAFFCECGDSGCYEPVWLTAAEYQQSRDEAATRLLAYGHADIAPHRDAEYERQLPLS